MFDLAISRANKAVSDRLGADLHKVSYQQSGSESSIGDIVVSFKTGGGMKLRSIKLLLETLLQMSREEKRSLSEIVQGMVSGQLRDRHKMMLAAQDLLMDYRTDSALMDFTALDGESFFTWDDDCGGS